MTPRRILLFHTAFIGDVILTLPVLQALRERFPGTEISVVAVPSAAGVIPGHPGVDHIIPYDKRGKDRGIRGILALARQLKSLQFDLAIVPHRSLRSAVITRLAGIPRRIGFTTSAGRMLFTDTVRYRRDVHEIDRNLDLLQPLGERPSGRILPEVYPNADDENVVIEFLRKSELPPGTPLVAIAPGSVWNTKRWFAERYTQLARMLQDRGYAVVLLGSEADRPLCEAIAVEAGGAAASAAGSLSLLQSAALLRKCDVLVTNDSAPEHLAVAVGTPVVAIFGPTVPSFGFAPAGPFDVVVETPGLSCRPCAIHGGKRCPLGTFECMIAITPEQVVAAVEAVVAKVQQGSKDASGLGVRSKQ